MSKTDNENVIRALTDQPLIEPLRCHVGFHKWTEWVTEKTRDEFGLGGVFQASHCVLCGRIRHARPIIVESKK